VEQHGKSSSLRKLQTPNPAPMFSGFIQSGVFYSQFVPSSLFAANFSHFINKWKSWLGWMALHIND
jgi:hypothetical protein